MRLLITGGAGYIGSFITKKFLTLNNINSITCVDNLFFKQEFKNKSKKIKNIVNDVRDKNKMIELYKSHDIIIPLAALVGAPICKKYPKETEEINFKVVDHMCKNLSASQIVIMPVSNSGYGIGEKDKFCTDVYEYAENEEVVGDDLTFKNSCEGTRKINIEHRYLILLSIVREVTRGLYDSIEEAVEHTAPF